MTIIATTNGICSVNYALITSYTYINSFNPHNHHFLDGETEVPQIK